tara:strand:+ start:1719 stop:3248 length:1530 start_codon:yes stop_codon:yes gene_type:complete
MALINIGRDNSARDRFYNQGSSQFGISDVPPEVFGRLNVHAQRRLKEGGTVPINPGFYKASQDKPVATSLLGAGPVAPGMETQPARVVAQYNPPSVEGKVEAPVYGAPDASGALPDPEMRSLDLPVMEQPQGAASLPITSKDFNETVNFLAGNEFADSLKGEQQDRAIKLSGQLQGMINEGSFDPSGPYSAEKMSSLLSQVGSYGLGEAFMKSQLAPKALTKFMGTTIPGTSGLPTLTPGLDSLGTTFGKAMGGASAGFIGNTLAELIMGEEGLHTDIGSGVGGAIGFALGTGASMGGPIGAGIGALVGGVAGAAFGDPSLHGGEESVGRAFYSLEANTSQFTGDRFADFAKNMALARLANPNEGADSVSDALRGMGDRVINEGDVDSQTVLGFKQLIQEGYATKQEILDAMGNDLELFRKDVEAIKEPEPVEKPVAVPDSEITFNEPAPKPPTPPEPTFIKEGEKPKPKAKEKPKTPPTTQTGPRGLDSEPPVYKPSLASLLRVINGY